MTRGIRSVVVLVCVLEGGAAAAADSLPTRGPSAAPVQVVLFADLTAPEAANAFVVLDALMDQQPPGVALTFRHLPAANDSVSHLAHRLAASIAPQDEFWPLVRVMFANQQRLGYADLIVMARQVGVKDEAQLVLDTFGAASEDALARDVSAAAANGITGRVGVTVNGRLLPGIVTRTVLVGAIEAAGRVR